VGSGIVGLLHSVVSPRHHGIVPMRSELRPEPRP
jgi:hypothetical protein